MHHTNSMLESKKYLINEIPANSRETLDIFQNINKTFLDKNYDLSQLWELQKSISIRNATFEYEFTCKSRELEDQHSYPEYWEPRYGFLATIKDKMIDKVAKDGLEVKMCPYNYLGYNIAGVHISQHADVCLTEARSKIVHGDEVILIVFQYMLGKRKIVPMHDPKCLQAPTPMFDSHICEERPDPKEKKSLQYIKSMVYLYEFANGNMEPVTRPRHCFPVAALIFKDIPSYAPLDNAGTEPLGFYPGPYQSPLSLLKPVSQYEQQPSFWGRQTPQSEFKKSSIIVQKNDEDIRKIVVSAKDKDLYDIEDPTTVEDNWRYVNYNNQYQNEASREAFLNLPRMSRNGDSMVLKSVERDRSSERAKKWSELKSAGTTRGFETSSRLHSRGFKK